MQESDLGVAHELERRQETDDGASAGGAVDSHQDASYRPRPTSEDRDRAGRISRDGQRSAADQEPLEAAETSGSERDHVRANLLRYPDDLYPWISQPDVGVDVGPPSSEDLGGSLARLARL